MTSQEIRAQFIDFFAQKHAHRFVPSSPVVPVGDPTLLFTNAGMNQFKPIFLGQETRDYARAVNTQKCIRAGGKHNDLDDVGRSRRHHTFFEMLGNWSFGDYFKRGAIEMAWELLTQVWKLDPSRLHVSCYEGDAKNNIPRDTEAADLWKEIAGIPDDHIHYFGKDNFWEMGETGPCGPCSEIYVDRTPDKTGGPEVNGNDPRVMEIWNLVFIQYNRDAAGKLTPLPAQHVDTGMGLERICQVIQNKQDNYATDLWTPLFERISQISNLRYTGLFPPTNAADPVAEADNAQLRYDIAFRVVADHARCLTFALTDGAVPSNEGRGYVLRRILRRAARFGRQQLGLTEPFMHLLVEPIVESMSSAFPELKENPSRVQELIRDEEVSFSKTLDRGIQLFEEAAQAGKIGADDAFKLHDTYGFPIDLTRIMAEERGMSVDVAGYEVRMEQARDLARAGGKGEVSRLTDLPPAALAQLAQTGVRPTDDAAKFEHNAVQSQIQAIWNGEELANHPVQATDDQELAIILDRTNFYAEMGGQVGDAGVLRGTSAIFDVRTTKAVAGFTLHLGRLRSGTIRVGERVTAEVAPARQATEQNHTTTHLANWALREVLGEGIQQKGSLVDADKLRFDFSHGKALGDDELSRVETLVNERIGQNLAVDTAEAPQELALQINGLRAVFGEKYPPNVRVVSIGAKVSELLSDPKNPKWRGYSVEFCGGTHLSQSGGARSFAVMAEEAVSKGIRRIVARTGEHAQRAASAARQVESMIQSAQTGPDEKIGNQLQSINQMIAAGELPLRAKRKAQAAVVELQARLKAAEKTGKSRASGSVDVSTISTTLLASASRLGSGQLIVGEVPGASSDELLATVDSLKKKAGSYAILLASAENGKVNFVAAVSDDLIKLGLKAGDWIRETAKVAGGGGGGRPQLAQAGGKDAGKIEEALAKGREFAVHAFA